MGMQHMALRDGSRGGKTSAHLCGGGLVQERSCIQLNASYLWAGSFQHSRAVAVLW